MSGRICYIARPGGGDRIAGVRIAGLRGEEQWASPVSAGDAMSVLGETNQAAAFIATHAGRFGIALLVVDVGGGQCRWVTAPGAEPAVVAAAMAQTEEWDGSRAFGSAWGAPSIAEACVQTLAPNHPKEGGNALALREDGAAQRMGALAIPDVSARLLLDALDQRGITVERAVSLWHAMALAWDPAARNSPGTADVVATSAPVTGIILAEDKRIVWSWSRSGQLLAGGTVRLPARQGSAVQIAAADVARLAADWLSWSVQLGVAPSRVIVLTPTLESGPDGLSAADLGSHLGKTWPGATVDLAVHEDPLGVTLGRLAALADEAAPDEERGQAMVTLTRRPGRSHRAMYRWSALAMFVGSLALAGIAWKAWDSAGDARGRTQDVRAQITEQVQQVVPPRDVPQQEMLANAPSYFLETQLSARRTLLNPTGALEPSKPILSELDALSYVLGNPDFRISNVELGSSAVLITVEVPDTAAGEELIRSMRNIYGSKVAEWSPVWQDASGSARRTVLLQGRWAPDAARRPGGPS